MIYGNHRMIKDVKAKGGTVDQRAQRWSLGLQLVSITSSILHLYQPEFLYMNDLQGLNLGVSLTSYIGSTVAAGVQQKRSRRAYQGLAKPQTLVPSKPQLVIRPVLSPQHVGFMGQF